MLRINIVNYFFLLLFQGIEKNEGIRQNSKQEKLVRNFMPIVDITGEPNAERIKYLSDLKKLFCKYLKNYTTNNEEFDQQRNKYIIQNEEYIVTDIFCFKQKGEIEANEYYVLAKKNLKKKSGFNYYIIRC